MKPLPVITSKSNERVKALREGFRGRASRPGELVSLEGGILFREAAAARLEFEAVFVCEGYEQAFAQAGQEKLLVLSREVFASAVDTHSPQGLAALVRIPPEHSVSLQALHGVALLLESVQDPGNLGTLLRSAEAFGAEAVFLVGETVNPWSPKVLRASAGSAFRVPIARLPSLDVLKALGGLSVYAAMAQRAFVDSVLDMKLQFPCVLMVGNEGAGLSGEAVDAATHKVWIPCATESLNAGVAGSLLLYEAMRQRGGL